MIEYLYDAIKASSGQDIAVAAELTDASGNPFTEACHLMLFDKQQQLFATIDGTYDAELAEWAFVIPANLTQGLSGRYWYCICHESESLCFKQPLYLS